MIRPGFPSKVNFIQIKEVENNNQLQITQNGPFFIAPGSPLNWSMQSKTNSVCKNKLLVPRSSRELITFARHLEGKWHSYRNRSASLSHKLQLHTLNTTGLHCGQKSWPGTSSCFTRLRPFTEFNSSPLSWIFLGQAPSLKINSHVCYLWQTVWPPNPGMQSCSCRSWASLTAEGSSTAELQPQRSHWTESHFIALISQWYFNFSGQFELEISSSLVHDPVNHTDLLKVKL